MDIGAFDGEFVQGFLDGGNTVFGLCHGGANVRHDDHRLLAVQLDHLGKVFIIHLTIGLGTDDNAFHVQQVKVFLNTVVGCLAVVNDPVGIEFSGKIKGIKVSLRAPIGYIAPVVVGWRIEKIGIKRNHFPFKRLAMHVIGLHKWISDIVDAVLHQRIEVSIIVVSGYRVADIVF